MRLYEAATLGWHMELMRSIYPRWDQPYAESLSQRFDLKPQQKIKGLSHGQRVKAALLLALARRPRCWCWTSRRRGWIRWRGRKCCGS